MIKNKFTKLSSILAKASAVAIIASSTSALAISDAEWAAGFNLYNTVVKPEIIANVGPALSVRVFAITDPIIQQIATSRVYQRYSQTQLNDIITRTLDALTTGNLAAVQTIISPLLADIGASQALTQQINATLDSLENSGITPDQMNQVTTELNSTAENEEQADEADYAASVSAISNSTQAVTQVQASMITNQLDSSLMQMKSGASSGSENIYNGGVWVKGFGQQATQKATKKLSAYKNTTVGGVVGVDSLLSDSFTLGAAVGYAATNIKLKSSNIKFDAKTWILSVYGAYEFNDNLYAKSSLTYALSNTKADLKLGLDKKTKMKSSAFLGDIALGYKASIAENVILAPELGFRASVFKDGKINAKDTLGADVINLKSRSGNNFQGSLGARLSSDLGSESMSFTPSIHAKVVQQLGGKYPKINGTFYGDNFSIKAEKPQKTMFVAGADVSLSNGPVDVDLGYEANMAKKYLSHTGSLKLRVNF